MRSSCFYIASQTAIIMTFEKLNGFKSFIFSCLTFKKVFWEFFYWIQIISLLSSPACSFYYVPTLPLIHNHFFIMRTCTHCTHTYRTCVHTHTHTRNLLSLFTVACMYIFKIDHLGLHNILENSSLGETDSPSLGSHKLPVVFHLGMRPCEIPPSAFVSTGIVIMHVFLGDSIVEISWL